MAIRFHDVIHQIINKSDLARYFDLDLTLTTYHTIPSFTDSEKNDFEKH